MRRFKTKWYYNRSTKLYKNKKRHCEKCLFFNEMIDRVKAFIVLTNLAV